ncbi:MAG: hypothetical protein KKC11_02160 [Candidatus Omnitrophica bacterium]|nr:hypothetical protein [Candidatus Omnitrophota bacterium]MBU0896422.1 hypothetical protein [Candidatus Omnitrophota bacterium]
MIKYKISKIKTQKYISKHKNLKTKKQENLFFRYSALAFCILHFAICNFYGCGYSTRGFVYNEDKIYINPAVNTMDITSQERKYSSYRSFPILLEKKLTNALVNKFNIDGQLKTVSQEEGALKLSCSIKDYEKEALRYDDSEQVKEQRLWLRVGVKLTDSMGKVVKEEDIVGEASFFLSGKSETTAQEELINDTARRILEAVIEKW